MTDEQKQFKLIEYFFKCIDLNLNVFITYFSLTNRNLIDIATSNPTTFINNIYEFNPHVDKLKVQFFYNLFIKNDWPINYLKLYPSIHFWESIQNVSDNDSNSTHLSTQTQTHTIENKNYEYVNHPSHYNNYSKEVIDMMVDIYGKENTALFCEMNAFKYRMRMGTKPDNSIQQDLNKEKWYLNKAKELKNINISNIEYISKPIKEYYGQ